MIITEYRNTAHRQQTIDLWKKVFGYEATHNEPGLVIDKKVAVDDLLYVAVKDDEVIGTIMAGYDGHRGWVYSVAVHPDHRRKGLGSKLLEYAQDKLVALGCNKINLQILEKNKNVQAFYAAHGYEVEERVSMGKRLS